MGRKTPELCTIRKLLKATFDNHLGIIQVTSIYDSSFSTSGKVRLRENPVLF